MDGVTLLQMVPGINSILLIAIFIVVSVITLMLIITVVWDGIINKNDESLNYAFPAFIFLVCSILCGVLINEDRVILENCYYYATIEDNVTMNEFFEHYNIIKHEPDSSLWLIKEKTIQTEEN